SGLVKCSICGASLSYNTGKYPYFVCWRYAKGFHKGSSSISENRLIKAVIEYLEQILDGMDFSISYVEKDTPELTEQEQWEKDLENLSVREKRIRTAYETGVDSLEEYKENKERLKKEREELEAKKVNLIKTAAAPGTKEQFLDKVQTVFDILKNDEISNETKGVFIRSIVEEIIYDKENDTLIFHLYTPRKAA
ncbi:MAG: zinc ribbon domain-containing protein, partial [Blautia hansenii]